MLHGYHVQITARSEADIEPSTIVQKVADASGSKYSGGGSVPTPSSGPPPIASKPVFQPTRIGGGGGFNPQGSRVRLPQAQDQNVDADGWGADAPPVTRSQLEKVSSAYQPTKVNMANLSSQQQDPVRLHGMASSNAPPPSNGNPDVVKGAYQPIGKVDIAEIRRQAKESGSTQDDRPTTVKGAYEPVGKVDIAEIRRRAQGPGGSDAPPPTGLSPAATGASAGSGEERQASLAERSAAFQQSERLTTLPKPKVANKFGGQSSFQGTKAPVVNEYGMKTPSAAAPVGTASKTFADEGGKTPAQIWAEKKARQGGSAGGSSYTGQSPSAPIAAQTSGGAGWKSGYTGKSWAPVQTTRTGQSAASNASREEEQPQEEEPTSGGVGSIRDRFAAEPPPMDMSSKPNAGGAMPGLPTRPRDVPQEQHVNVPPPPAMVPRPDEDEEEEDDVRPSSPIRIAQPVARTATRDLEPADEPEQAMPAQSLANLASRAVPEPEPQVHDDDPARGAAQLAAVSSFGPGATAADHGAEGGPRAVVEYDYEKAEDNEIELREGAYVTDIDQVDTDWWMGTNEQGERGLFPSNYVKIMEADEHHAAAAAAPAPVAEQVPPAGPPAGASKAGPTATAQYDYEAAEENELSFPDGATIEEVVSTIYISAFANSTDSYYRNSQMMIGGLATTEESLGCSRQTMCN